ncbi:MAG: AAA family ATPase [Methylococcaceae bacterium]|nr:AAA family ATPase [Methylococcaceae bacterium]
MDYSTVFYMLPPGGIWQGDEHSPPYLFTREIAIRVDVAYATRRPLLVSGPPGSGKSTLAQAIAGIQQSSFLMHTLTSRSRIGDLTADVDQLQRLHDAQAAAKKDIELLPDWAYQRPGLFWWAFESGSASMRGGDRDLGERFTKPEVPGYLKDGNNPEAVLLLDEIDKAEPDLPNDLLEPLDRRGFRRPDGKPVSAPEDLKLLVVITTNKERALPAAFLRRCVSLELDAPGEKMLIDIAKHHVRKYKWDRDNKSRDNTTLYTEVARKYLEVCSTARDQDRRVPGTSEYLDAVRACLELNVAPDGEVWKLIETATLNKAPDT